MYFYDFVLFLQRFSMDFGSRPTRTEGSKIKNCKYLSSDKQTVPGNLRTYPYVGVGGAHGTNARARRERAAEIFVISRF